MITYNSMSCAECHQKIRKNVYNYSIKKYGIPLCIEDQEWIEEMEERSTIEAIRLYFALKRRGVPAEMEKFDGYKHIDIAVVQAKVNIEVDGSHHNFNRRQALSDLKRTYHSFKKGYFTLRIPNSLIKNEKYLEETTDYIVSILNINKK